MKHDLRKYHLECNEILARLRESEKRIVIIMMGLPGAGKSTFVKVLEDALPARVHSSDRLIEAAHDGEYVFDERAIIGFHRQNQANFKRSVYERVKLIVVDNTGLATKNRSEFASVARRAGYETKILLVGDFTVKSLKVYAARNNHGVTYSELLGKLGRVNVPPKELIWAHIGTKYGYRSTLDIRRDIAKSSGKKDTVRP